MRHLVLLSLGLATLGACTASQDRTPMRLFDPSAVSSRNPATAPQSLNRSVEQNWLGAPNGGSQAYSNAP